jgi:hypothetical protein
VAGTQVVTGLNADGSLLTRSIEALQVGDLVLARDQHDPSAPAELRRVTQAFRRTSDHIRVLTIEGDDGNIEILRTTDEHPFYVRGRGWVGAGELRVGDLVQEMDGTWQSVLAMDRQSHSDGIAVYNQEATPTSSRMASARRMRCGCIMVTVHGF